MFKKLEYLGFRDHPDLLVLAERATSLLADEIRSWREDVEVTWDAAPQSGSVFLELRLALLDWTGIVRRLMGSGDFADERRIRAACRDAWGRLLDKFLARTKDRLTQFLAEPVEA
ncbi:MAG: hypothetical protein K2X87_10725 [Gemmataceae bacterium]|nr:hypothetical protein [Gemmataceae bacterium]